MAKKLGIKSLEDFRRYKELIDPKELKNNVVATLADYGERIIKLAYSTKIFKDRTYNLRDSYASAVFVNGHMVKNTDRYVGEPMSNVAREYDETASGDPEMKTGREEARLLLSKFQFTGGRPGGIVLVVVAAMFYADILEKRYKYLVLSQVGSEMDAIAQLGLKLNGSDSTIPKFYVSSPRTYREGGTGRMEINL